MSGEFYFGMLTFGCLIWLAGRDLIDTFFKRKEELLNRMIEKGIE